MSSLEEQAHEIATGEIWARRIVVVTAASLAVVIIALIAAMVGMS